MYATKPDELGRIHFQFYVGSPDAFPEKLEDRLYKSKKITVTDIPPQYEAVRKYFADHEGVQGRHLLGHTQFTLRENTANWTHHYPKGNMGKHDGSRGFGAHLAELALNHLESTHGTELVGVWGNIVDRSDTREGEISPSAATMLKNGAWNPTRITPSRNFGTASADPPKQAGKKNVTETRPPAPAPPRVPSTSTANTPKSTARPLLPSTAALQ